MNVKCTTGGTMQFFSGTRRMETRKRKYKLVRVDQADSQLDLFEDSSYHFVYTSEDGEVTHPTHFATHGNALAGGRAYVEFINR